MAFVLPSPPRRGGNKKRKGSAKKWRLLQKKLKKANLDKQKENEYYVLQMNQLKECLLIEVEEICDKRKPTNKTPKSRGRGLQKGEIRPIISELSQKRNKRFYSKDPTKIVHAVSKSGSEAHAKNFQDDVISG